ncbi:MAG: hypothetical protein KJ749_09050 [Planctomycetes bacterium]|nr:hypothetical protein [Planctomycetota bacterium]
MVVEQVRREFMQHFTAAGYQPAESAPLVIPELHTTFVMSVGLLQLKAVLTPHSDKKRFPTFCMVQRCLRHFDIENAGMANHLSFFEMAGAISSGDRSQQEVLESIFEYLTGTIGLDKGRLFFSTFSGGEFLGREIPADDTSREALARLGVSQDRLLRRGAESNFFGNTARDNAYGPSVEVYFDRGPQSGCPEAGACQPDCRCQRYVEVGTCVFLQYIRNNGSFRRMPRAFCEAGVGVERLAFASSDLSSIHQLKPLLDVAEFMMEKGLLVENAGRQADICSDHLRGAVFAIADGARPGGSGRSHLLRTLIRRLLVRTDRRDDRVIEYLPALVDMVADGNRHVVDLSVKIRTAIRETLADEIRLFQANMDSGKIRRGTYLREATR